MNILKSQRKCNKTDKEELLIPQLHNCFFQTFLLLYLILFSSFFIFWDLQKEKKHKNILASGSQPFWSSSHQGHQCPSALLLVVWAGKPAALGAENYQDVADPIFTGRTALFALSWSFSAMLTVEIWIYSGGCVGPVPTGLLSLCLGASLEARVRAALSSQWIYAQCILALVTREVLCSVPGLLWAIWKMCWWLETEGRTVNPLK